ncbi:unnamed protein product [Moneuplotes crassus]|uniref:Uncharacterized protein n=1 Tax=Euplotes crassus TaxID=5936 RepID=A0AAD1UP48_EUPCR|nr:unnamed protein product [Moneuplotes crassus]
MKKFTEEEVGKLTKLFLKKFLDIPKILNTLDSDMAEEFKKRNGAAYYDKMTRGLIEHNHSHDDGDLCEEMHSTIFIDEKDQNAVEKLIAEEIYPPRFKLGLKSLLEEIHYSYKMILSRLQAKVEAGEGPESVIPMLPGMEKPKEITFSEEECKQIMKKISYESVNRYFKNKIKAKIMEKEKTYAHQPMLLAFPNGAPKEAELDQIESTNIEKFMSKGFCVQKQFINFSKTELCFKELVQLQREGRFQDIRTLQNMMEKTRTDQTLKFNYHHLGEEEEVKELKPTCEKLSWLPFECNKYCPDLSLQVNESIDIHYFSEKESFYKRHKNSDKKYDTGIKVTAILVVREFDILDTEDKSRIKLENDQGEIEELELGKGDLLLLKSREIYIEFSKHYEKTFYVCTNISGPLKPHE